MVHHTMNTNTSSAPSASSSNKVMLTPFIGRWAAATARASLPVEPAEAPADVPPDTAVTPAA